MSNIEHAFGLTFDLGEYTADTEVALLNHLKIASEARQQEPKEEQARLQQLYDEIRNEPPGYIAARYLDLVSKVVEAHQKST